MVFTVSMGDRSKTSKHFLFQALRRNKARLKKDKKRGTALLLGVITEGLSVRR